MPVDRGDALAGAGPEALQDRTYGEIETSRLERAKALRLAACLGAVLAAGCGGDGDEVSIPPPPELLQITAGNQVAVAKAVVLDFALLDGTRDIPIAGSSGAPGTSGAEASVKHALATAISTTGRALPMGTISITEPCPSGGSIAITLDDRDNNATVSDGDVLTSAFNDCRESPTAQLTGGFTINLAPYTPTQFSGLLTFGQLTLSDVDGTIALNGPANLLYTDTTDASGTRNLRTEMTVASGGVVARVSSPKVNETLSHDPGFNGVWTEVYPSTPSAGYDTSALKGTVLSASLGGEVILATDPPVKELFAEEMARSGTVLITGFQSKLRMTVLDATTARLELDANDDGTYESTRDIPWGIAAFLTSR